MGFIGFIAEILVLGGVGCGIAANIAVVTTCDVLVLGGNNGKIGPWRADYRGSGCQTWHKEETTMDDWILNMARACSMMALCFACIFLFFLLFKQCLCPLPCSQPIMDITGTLTNISLALVWPIIRSSVCDRYGCSWGGGYTALLLTQIFYLVASVFTRCMREPRYERRKEEREQEKVEKAEAPKPKEEETPKDIEAPEEAPEEPKREWYDSVKSTSKGAEVPNEAKKQWYEEED
mmetsp:Transcript_51476/g.95266  ORF Transcript_51476/g.95266 Transcript_51476/m.95266 type:complete len:235 (-) Transcript_51476:328-1032(-)|eukprot:CAMPEP_0197444930 /NCGR_PEP_ID=MMETSP1175-20131217/10264_1 /TAXON_ID=1003142 /ORGANISM="Triceratium dubium, Strain CCMP147" /LENGTH=234 /DNA_ID=CAMNT_0042975799 /DNA_START=175 /DNA_END=879 /DNA_ORIENTATION=-